MTSKRDKNIKAVRLVYDHTDDYLLRRGSLDSPTSNDLASTMTTNIDAHFDDEDDRGRRGDVRASLRGKR
jgi:hypothetical protein